MGNKHFVDDVDNLVVDALECLTLGNPGLVLNREQKSLSLSSHDGNSHVSLISGGGAGHEPAHAAFVGPSLLTGAVSGNIFASPSVRQILSCIESTGGSQGVLLILKNYTGDVFHFSLAAEKACATLGLQVETLVVGDDVSVGRKKGGKVGRRGLAGTVLVHKILGGMAADGRSLADIKGAGERIVAGLATVGASLDHVHIPGRPDDSTLSLEADQLELGMGIHNEPGCKILSPRPPLSNLLDTMLAQILDSSDLDRAYVNFKEANDIVLLVNNLGGLSVLEISAITTNVVRKLARHQLVPRRILSGTFMTSLDGPGFSITLLKADQEILSYLNAPCSSAGWTQGKIDCTRATPSTKAKEATLLNNRAANGPNLVQTEKKTRINLEEFISVVSASCASVVAQESLITEYDTIVGDGDCGSTLKRGAEAVSALVSSGQLTSNALNSIILIAETIEDSMDGTSGAMFGIFFNALAAAIRALPDSIETMNKESWATVAASALQSLKKATAARLGDRTLIDALEPFIVELSGDTFEHAVLAARRGTEKTQSMTPAFGRAVYVSEEMCRKVPDPGAVGILAIVEGLFAGSTPN